MKTLVILFTLFYFLNALAVAPYGFKGQSQSQTLYSNVLQAPNQLVTNLGGINALMETGNKNILANPSFEAPLVSFAAPSWSSLGFLTNNITPPVSGQKAVQVSMTASALSLHQDSGVNNAAYGDGLQCLASVYVKTTLSGIFVSPRLNNVTSNSNMVSVVPNGKWALYKVPFICSTGANGIAIHSNSVAVTGTVDVDDAFVGAVNLQVDVPVVKSQYANLESTATFTGNVAITGALTNTNGSGLFSYDSGTGIYTALENIDVVMTVACRTSTATAGFCSIRTSNTTIEDSETMNQAINSLVSAAKTFNIKRGGTFSAQKGISATSIDRASVSVTATLEINSSVYTSNNSDTDWASCGLTGAAFTGFGSAVPTPSLQCKRQGGDLLIKGNFTAGTTPTAVEARMELPVWNGVQLISANSSIIPLLQLAGTNGVNTSSATRFGHYVLIEPSVSYLTFSVQSSTLNAVTKATGSTVASTGSLLSIDARIPIEGWQGSNFLVGSFSGLESCSSTLDCTDTFSATITNTGTVVAGSENVDFISGNCSKGGTGITNCTINTGVFSVVPNLVATIDDGAGGCREARSVETNTNTSFRIDTFTSAGVAADCRFRVMLQKSAADYVGKTARAVSSDQNLRTPGVTKGVVYSAFISSTGTILSEIGDFINGSCSVVSTNVFTCNFNASAFASDPVCQVTVMGASGASRSVYIVTSPTTSSITYLTYNTSGPTAIALNVQLTCHGISP